MVPSVDHSFLVMKGLPRIMFPYTDMVLLTQTTGYLDPSLLKYEKTFLLSMAMLLGQVLKK